jgi:hypothetical protein
MKYLIFFLPILLIGECTYAQWRLNNMSMNISQTPLLVFSSAGKGQNQGYIDGNLAFATTIKTKSNNYSIAPYLGLEFRNPSNYLIGAAIGFNFRYDSGNISDRNDMRYYYYSNYSFDYKSVYTKMLLGRQLNVQRFRMRLLGVIRYDYIFEEGRISMNLKYDKVRNVTTENYAYVAELKRHDIAALIHFGVNWRVFKKWYIGTALEYGYTFGISSGDMFWDNKTYVNGTLTSSSSSNQTQSERTTKSFTPTEFDKSNAMLSVSIIKYF